MLLGSSFFFSCGDGALTDPAMVLHILVFRLAWFHPSSRYRVGAVLKENPDVGHQALSLQLERLAVVPLLPLGVTDRSPASESTLDWLTRRD